MGVQGYDIVFYGDSITENWRGTSGGLHWKLWDDTLDTNFIAADMRSVFLSSFGYKYRCGVMAIAGKDRNAILSSFPSWAQLSVINLYPRIMIRSR